MSENYYCPVCGRDTANPCGCVDEMHVGKSEQMRFYAEAHDIPVVEIKMSGVTPSYASFIAKYADIQIPEKTTIAGIIDGQFYIAEFVVPKMKVYAIEEECADGYYGWFVSELFTTRELAEKKMAILAEINKGIDYRVIEWDVTDSERTVDND